MRSRTFIACVALVALLACHLCAATEIAVDPEYKFERPERVPLRTLKYASEPKYKSTGADNVYVPRLSMSPGDTEGDLGATKENDSDLQPYTEGHGVGHMPVYPDELRSALHDSRDEWSSDCCGSSSCSNNDCSYTSCSCSTCCTDDYWYVILGIFVFFLLFGGIALCIAAAVPYPANYYGTTRYHGPTGHRKQQHINIYQRNGDAKNIGDDAGDWTYGPAEQGDYR